MFDKKLLLQHIKNRQRTVQEQIDLAKRERDVKASLAGREQRDKDAPMPVKGSPTNLSDTRAKLGASDKLDRARVREVRLDALKRGDKESAATMRGTSKQAGDKLKAHIMKDLGHEGQTTDQALGSIKSELKRELA